MTKWKPPKRKRMNKEQMKFLANLNVHDLCNLVEDVYYKLLNRDVQEPKDFFQVRRRDIFNEAKRLGLTDDNGVRLALELVKACKYSSI